MGLTFLIFVTQEQNLTVLDTRSFISSMTEVNTIIMVFGMFGGPHQPESLAVRASIAKAQIKDSRLYFTPLIQEGKISKYKYRHFFGLVLPFF